MKIDISLIAMGVAGYFLFLKPKSRNITTWSSPDTSNKVRKFPGYQIKDQIIYISNSDTAKKYVFDVGKTEPEGALFKKARYYDSEKV